MIILRNSEKNIVYILINTINTVIKVEFEMSRGIIIFFIIINYKVKC